MRNQINESTCDTFKTCLLQKSNDPNINYIDFFEINICHLIITVIAQPLNVLVAKYVSITFCNVCVYFCLASLAL